MVKHKSIVAYRKKTDVEVKHIINNILNQLENYGRAISNNGHAVRAFSRFMEEPIRREHIYFNYNKRHKMSVITLPPSIKLVRLSDNKIRLIFDKSSDF